MFLEHISCTRELKNWNCIVYILSCFKSLEGSFELEIFKILIRTLLTLYCSQQGPLNHLKTNYFIYSASTVEAVVQIDTKLWAMVEPQALYSI